MSTLSTSILRYLALAVMTGWAVTTARSEFIFDAEVPLETQVEKAIDRAQEWVAKTQQSNGSWGTCNGVNAMSLIALMVNGGTPGHTKYGDKIAKCVEFLINNQRSDGYLIVGKTGNMYQHGLATIALCEAYGMTQNPAIRESLTKAIQLTLKAQGPSGGWTYQPITGGNDLSITVIQVMSLRAASDAGIYVPRNAIDVGIKCVRNHWNPQTTGFGYSGPGDVNPRMTAGGTVCLFSCGLEEDPTIPLAIKYLSKNITFTGGGNDRMNWYGQYYASLAFYHRGGDAWKAYYQKICQQVLEQWQQAGHFQDPLTTAWAIIVIGTPYRYLPIYQR